MLLREKGVAFFSDVAEGGGAREVGEHEEGREGEEEKEGKRGVGRRDGVWRRVSRRVGGGVVEDIPNFYNSFYGIFVIESTPGKWGHQGRIKVGRKTDKLRN